MRGFPRSFMRAQARYDSLTPDDVWEPPECEVCGGDEDYVVGMRDAIQEACCLLEDLAASDDAPEAVRAAHKLLMEVEI